MGQSHCSVPRRMLGFISASPRTKRFRNYAAFVFPFSTVRWSPIEGGKHTGIDINDVVTSDFRNTVE